PLWVWSETKPQLAPAQPKQWFTVQHTGISFLLEASWKMSETEERTGLDSRSGYQTTASFEEEEPPGKPRRHPLWRNVPENQWNDWRWQSQNAIRSVRQLRDLLPFSSDELEAIGSLEGQYKLAIPP